MELKTPPWLRGHLEELLKQGPDVLVLRLTLLLLLLHGSSTWALELPLKVLCALMLVSRSLLLDRWMWMVVATAMLWINAAEWAWIDNHKYLVSYWCLACALAVGTRNRTRVLATNGRWLLGLVFGLAVIWKILAGQYLDGSFLHYTALTDSRLEVPARLAGGLSGQLLSQNRQLEKALMEFPGTEVSVTLNSSPALRLAGLLGSWWTLLIEGLVALAFLLPKRFRLTAWRDGLLMIFVVTTYGLLPVVGFALVLTVMGLAQCEPERQHIRVAYILLFIVAQLVAAPWQGAVDAYLPA